MNIVGATRTFKIEFVIDLITIINKALKIKTYTNVQINGVRLGLTRRNAPSLKSTFAYVILQLKN